LFLLHKKTKMPYTRIIKTIEVTVSKIFPAGVGWQLASSIVDSAPDSLEFALSTGTGEAVAVGCGHIMYNKLFKNDIVPKENLQTGVMLSTAAFCSGCSWQPIVNTLQGADIPFLGVQLGTSIGCGFAFLVGIRMVRSLVDSEYITQTPLTQDIQLAASIGGATGCFVGTDLSYLPAQNLTASIIGIGEMDGIGLACAKAGLSTSMGFGGVQTFQNLRTPPGYSWCD
jgi:hypothetical protein